jgi:hypothetical protein
MTARDLEKPLNRLLSEVEKIKVRFNGTTSGAADPVKSKEINNMPNERIKDLFRIIVTVAAQIQACDTALVEPNDPEHEEKDKDNYAQACQHLAFLMELVTLGISHLLVATEKFPGNKLVYTDNAKAYMLKAGIDNYLLTRFATHTQEVDSLRSTKVRSEASYTKCMVWFVNIYVGWILALTKIPLHAVKSTELRPAQTINRDMIPKVMAWFRALMMKSTSIADEKSKRGSVAVYTTKGTLEPWAQLLPILSIACNVHEDAEYTSTLLAQKPKESAGGSRKRTDKARVGRNPKNPKKQKFPPRRILEDTDSGSDDTY